VGQKKTERCKETRLNGNAKEKHALSKNVKWHEKKRRSGGGSKKTSRGTILKNMTVAKKKKK